MTFYADLHYVDIDTGAVTVVPTSGDQPVSRTSAVFFNNGGRLYVWAGYDGSALGDLYSVDINGGQWTHQHQDLSGRAAPSYCIHKGECYVFGSTKGAGLCRFNADTEFFEAVQAIGTAPQPTLNHTIMVSGDEYIFVVGGKANYEYMHLFALDVKRSWWFAFHVRPDMKSISLSDGFVSKIGLFMMPRQHSSSIAYSHKSRELVNVMGSRMNDPSPVYKISVGEAFGVLHLRSDMYEMFLLDCRGSPVD
jgi:hypothetical protein